MSAVCENPHRKAMRKLAEVEEARRIMTEAADWSMWRWLTEKRRVRAAADAANEALVRAEKKVKTEWPAEQKKSYAAALKAADEEARAALADAEATFDEAERRMSTSMAREGTQKALAYYAAHERAIRKAEAMLR
jgi:hypothetical protein